MYAKNLLIYDLNVELQVALLDEKIDEALRLDFEKNQKDFILREKLDEIKKELGEENTKDDIVSDYISKNDRG